MKYRNLGNSGLKVSEIGFGAWNARRCSHREVEIQKRAHAGLANKTHGTGIGRKGCGACDFNLHCNMITPPRKSTFQSTVTR